ncbi:MAG: hypothetical protein H6835_06295 [Planctomycetes bacterium]|nr:hypothetical protein [Planctomycetota bacterium]
MQPVDCAYVRPLLPMLAAEDPDGEAAGTCAAQVRAHLRECVGCRAEAGGFLRAGRALRDAVAARDAAVPDDALQQDLHAAIMARVAEIEWQDGPGHEAVTSAYGPGVLGFARWRRELPWRHVVALGAAAMLLAAIGFWAFGFWLGHGGERDSIWSRQPLQATSTGPLRAVPYAGPRFELLPVGLPIDDQGSAESGVGPGMMGRGRLRTPIDEQLPPPR